MARPGGGFRCGAQERLRSSKKRHCAAERLPLLPLADLPSSVPGEVKKTHHNISQIYRTQFEFWIQEINPFWLQVLWEEGFPKLSILPKGGVAL